jgi:uncharacterized membrane protein YbhN (UPF0104 family)
MESLQSYLDALATFADHLSSVALLPLAAALALHLSNLVLRSRAWLSILRAAFPGAPIAFRTVLGAYVAGVGVNAFAPARGGDVVKIAVARKGVEGSSIPSVAASLLPETLFDAVAVIALIGWAYGTDRLPGLPTIPDAAAFELSFVARHPGPTLIAISLLLIGGALAYQWLAHHARAFRRRIGQGVAILRSPRDYLMRVVPYQFVGWLCRLGSAWFLLDAFGVHASVENAALVMVVGSVSTLLPITPGGAGPQQALLVLVLAGEAATSALIAYSVGAQLTITVVNVTLGAVALLMMFGSVRLRHLHAEAH